MEKIKVLVVDDSIITKIMFSNIIKETEDIEIVGEASSGSECLSMVKNINPDVVMLKISIGGDMSAGQIVNEIRSVDNNPKIILCTDVSYKYKVEELISIEPDDFIVKPYQRKSILRIIRKVAKEPNDSRI